MARGRGLSLDVTEIRTEEMLTNIDEMKVAIMGMAEYIQEINSNVNHVRAELGAQRHAPPKPRSPKITRGLTVDEILKREELAQKIERLFRNDNVTKVNAVKQEMASVVETNMIKMLAAILLTGPLQAQERTPEILRVSGNGNRGPNRNKILNLDPFVSFQLMRNVLNKQIDFKPIVDRLPFLIRNSETNQFILLLKALRDVRNTIFILMAGSELLCCCFNFYSA